MNLGTINPQLKLKVSRRARRMALRLDTKERVMYLVVPPRHNPKTAHDFAREYSDWIEEKLSELPAPVKFHNGSTIPLFGRDVKIRIHYDPALKKTTFELRPRVLHVYTNRRDVNGRIARFLKQEAEKIIKALAVEKAARIGKKIAEVKIRDTKTRWASCADDGKLNFSWRLIFAPWDALDYVVAHEVAHLVHMNHGPAFWGLCARLSASFDFGRDWMRDHGHSLMRFG